MNQEDVYQRADFVRFYDWSYAGQNSDLPFILAIARQYGSPVLEVACGTGRLTIAMGREEFRTVGLDASEAMLELARHKLARESAPVRKLISLHLGNMRNFRLGDRFPLVLVPNASVFHLESEEALLACFSCLHAHTRDEGLVVVDVVSPELMSRQAEGEERLIGEGINPLTELHTREFNRTVLVDRRKRMVRKEHIYIEQAGESEKRYVFQQNYRWVERDEGMTLLRRAGFAPIEVFGDYNGAAYSPESPRMIMKAWRQAGR